MRKETLLVRAGVGAVFVAAFIAVFSPWIRDQINPAPHYYSTIGCNDPTCMATTMGNGGIGGNGMGTAGASSSSSLSVNPISPQSSSESSSDEIGGTFGGDGMTGGNGAAAGTLGGTTGITGMTGGATGGGTTGTTGVTGGMNAGTTGGAGGSIGTNGGNGTMGSMGSFGSQGGSSVGINNSSNGSVNGSAGSSLPTSGQSSSHNSCPAIPDPLPPGCTLVILNAMGSCPQVVCIPPSSHSSAQSSSSVECVIPNAPLGYTCKPTGIDGKGCPAYTCTRDCGVTCATGGFYCQLSGLSCKDKIQPGAEVCYECVANVSSGSASSASSKQSSSSSKSSSSAAPSSSAKSSSGNSSSSASEAPQFYCCLTAGHACYGPFTESLACPAQAIRNSDKNTCDSLCLTVASSSSSSSASQAPSSSSSSSSSRALSSSSSSSSSFSSSNSSSSSASSLIGQCTVYSFLVHGIAVGPSSSSSSSSSSSQSSAAGPFSCPSGGFLVGAGDPYYNTVNDVTNWHDLLAEYDAARGTHYTVMQFSTAAFARLGSQLYIGGSPGLFLCQNDILSFSNTIDQVNALAVHGGAVYAGVQKEVRRYNPGTLSYTVIGNFPYDIGALLDFQGTLYASTAGHVYQYGLNGWNEIGIIMSPQAIAPITALAEYKGQLYAGSGDPVGGATVGHVFRLTNGAWVDVTPDWKSVNTVDVTTTPASVNALAVFGNSLFAATTSYDFQSTQAIKSQGHAYAYDGAAWTLTSQQMGTHANALAYDPNSTQLIGGTSVDFLSGALWSYTNGNIWNFGSTFKHSVDALLTLSMSSSSQAVSSAPTVISISNVHVTNLRTTSAEIDWDTNVVADSQVEYGLLIGPPYTKSASTASFVSRHALPLTGLQPDTLYHFRVRSKDASNITAASGDYTFRTTSDGRIEVSENGDVIERGGTYDFGSTLVNKPVTKTFYIRNVGDTPLTVSSLITVPSGFALVQNITLLSLQPGLTTTFQVRMNADTLSTPDGNVSIPNSDVSQNPFIFRITGAVTETIAPKMEVSEGGNALSSDPTPSTIAFSTTAGTPVTKTITIRNAGNGTLSVGTINIGGTGFSWTSPSRTDLGANETTTFTVTFKATSVGYVSNILSIASNSTTPRSPFRLNVTGTAVSPTVKSPQLHVYDGNTELVRGGSVVDFGTTTPGTALSKTITIKNLGNGDLTVGTVSVPNGFSIAQQPQATVVAGGSTTFIVNFDAKAASSFDGWASFGHNDTNSPFTFVVRGNASASPDLQVLDGSTSITRTTGSVYIGSTTQGTPVTKTITVKNTGGATLTLTTPTVPNGFSITKAPPAVVQPGASATFNVQLDASSTGSPDGTLSFANNVAGKTPFTFRIQGNVGAAPAPEIDVLDGIASVPNNGDIDMGTTAQNKPLNRIFTVQNTGTAPLTLGSTISVPTGFSISAPFGKTTLAPGESTFFAVRLNAATAGSYSGNVFFTNNDANENPYTFVVQGIVSAPLIPLVEVRSDTGIVPNGGYTAFGSTPVGTAVTKIFSVRNIGGATLSLQSLSAPSGFTVVTSFAQTSLAPNASTNFTLRLTAGASGYSSGNVSFGTNDAGNNPFTFRIDGTATAPSVQLFDGTSQITYSTGKVDLGSHAKGDPHGRTITIKNPGTAPLKIGAITAPAHFAVTASASTSDAFKAVTIDAGDSASFYLTYKADTTGNVSGTVSVPTNVSGRNPFTFTVAAIGVAAPKPVMQLFDGIDLIAPGDTIDFGRRVLGHSIGRWFTVRNTGTANLVINSIGIGPGFSYSGLPDDTVVKPGAEKSVYIKFNSEEIKNYQTGGIFHTNEAARPSYGFNLTATVRAVPEVMATFYSANRGPYIDNCGIRCSVQWYDQDKQPPKLLVRYIEPGDKVTFTNVTGTIDWGGGDYPNPSSCRDGASAFADKIPKLVGVAQFTDYDNKVVDAGITTPGDRNAILLRDFVNITVPSGAGEIFGGFPDTKYSDNKGVCSFSITVTTPN